MKKFGEIVNIMVEAAIKVVPIVKKTVLKLKYLYEQFF